MERTLILKGPHKAHCTAGEYCQARTNPHLLVVGFICCCGYEVVEVGEGMVRLIKYDGSTKTETTGRETS